MSDKPPVMDEWSKVASLIVAWNFAVIVTASRTYEFWASFWKRPNPK